MATHSQLSPSTLAEMLDYTSHIIGKLTKLKSLLTFGLKTTANSSGCHVTAATRAGIIKVVRVGLIWCTYWT